MDPLAKEVQTGTLCQKFALETERHPGVSKVGTKPAFDVAIGTGDLALMLTGSATRQQQIKQVKVAGARWSVVVVNPRRAARDGTAFADLKRSWSECVIVPPEPAPRSIVKGFTIRRHSVLPRQLCATVIGHRRDPSGKWFPRQSWRSSDKALVSRRS